MIHYHGGPIWPTTAAVSLWTARHGLTSFEHPEQVALMAELCQSFVIDNGAFSKWRAGDGAVDVRAYASFVSEWDQHPGFDFAIIPDVIDGDERANDDMIAEWFGWGMRHGVPVWHLHESLERLARLAREYPRVALGSSGQWSTPGTPEWWSRMDEVRPVVTDERGRPIIKLHGLRMLNPTIFSHVSRIDIEDSRGRELADRHYSRQTPGSKGYAPPGLRFALWYDVGDGYQSTSRPSGAALWIVVCGLDPIGELRWRNTMFRNESAARTSWLCETATVETFAVWLRRYRVLPPMPLTTEIDIEATAARRSKHKEPGTCYLAAGWEHLRIIPAGHGRSAKRVLWARPERFGARATSL